MDTIRRRKEKIFALILTPSKIFIYKAQTPFTEYYFFTERRMKQFLVFFLFAILQHERFLPLANFSNYEISNYGRLRNIKTGCVRKPNSKNGYMFVQLSKKSGIRKNYYIHRLVAETHLNRPKPYKNYNYVNHKWLDKQINVSWGLEWISQAENIQHYFLNR